MNRRSTLLVGGLSLAGILVATALPLMLGREIERMDLLLGGLFIASLLPAALVLSRPDGDLFQPLPILGVVVFVYFVLRGVLLIHTDPEPAELPPNLRHDFERYLAPALGLVLASWCAAMIGYWAPVGRLFANWVPKVSFLEHSVNPARVLMVWAVGISFKAVKIARGTHLAFLSPDQIDHDTQSFIGFFSKFEEVALFLMGALYFSGRLNRFHSGMLWFVMMPAAVGYGVLTGSKMRIVMALILLMLSFHYFRRYVGIRHMVALALVFTFAIRPLVSNFRVLYNELQGRTTELRLEESIRTAQFAAQELQEDAGGSEEFVEHSLRKASKRMHGLDSVMVAMKMTPTFIPYVEPTQYLLLPAMALVPRVVWPDKPIMALLMDWETTYWGARDTGSSIARTHFGSLYLCFGWGGTVLGMLILGFIWRFLAELFHRHWGLLGAAMYVFVLLGMMNLENDVTAIYSMLIKLVLVLGVLCWFIGHREASTLFRAAPLRGEAVG